MRLSLIQMNLAFGDPEANFNHLQDKLREAMKERPDVIVFPELWSTGYDLTRIREIGDEDGKRTRAFLANFAKANNVHLVGGSIAEIVGEKAYNSSFVFDREGEYIARYRKVHLFRLMEEEKYLNAGDSLGLFHLEGTKAGVMICYDIRFPEFMRRLALEGAKVVFVPAEWPYPRLHHWRTLLMARAIENQIYIVACNRVGNGAGTEFFGHSMIIDPWGEVLAEGDEQESILSAEIDIAAVDEMRRRIPVFEDRRPELY